MKKLLAASGMALALFASPFLSHAETWDMPLAYSATNYHSENATDFAANVTRRTNGAVTIRTHAGGSLYKGGEIFPSVQRGLVPIGERLMSALGNEDPLFEVDALPFLATSFEDAQKLHMASLPELRKVLREKGLVFLYAVPWPPQGLYANRPINTVDDMRGLKFRAYNSVTSRLAELVGAVPTQIEAAEISQAFATGVAESMISSGSTGYDRKLWEYVDYWYDVQAWLPKNMVVVNANAWNSLSGKNQRIVLEEAANAEAAGWAKAEELNNWYKEQLAANGMQIAAPSPQLKQGFEAVGQQLVDGWLDRSGAQGRAVLASYQRLR
ncbi:MAG: TRAP transporter substrate-binding protein [Alphaproteobacteria bacterium]|nr:TRAP transporter substrate-binding protein [Alphaproteobacteria bacterium]